MRERPVGGDRTWRRLKEELIKCKDDNDALNNRIAALIRDTTTMGRDIRNYQTMLNTNMGEQDKLNALLQQKMSELDERERTINELQDMMNAQNAKVQNLLSSVKDALLGFNSDELTVTEKNGKVYVPCRISFCSNRVAQRSINEARKRWLSWPRC